MAKKPKGWTAETLSDGTEIEYKFNGSGTMFFWREAGTPYNSGHPDDPHYSVPVGSDGQPNWSSLDCHYTNEHAGSGKRTSTFHYKVALQALLAECCKEDGGATNLFPW